MDDPAFAARKAAVQATLASAAVDKSPKGTVDSRCWPMIDFLNGCDDFVTTSSCSGRVAMWQEPPRVGGAGGAAAVEDDDNDDAGNIDNAMATDGSAAQPAAGAGSNKKGGGGRWLHVTHDLPVPADFTDALKAYSAGVVPADGSASPTSPPAPFGIVWVRFEPYILHVQARSLAAASKLLKAGLGAGFRNSGIVAGGTPAQPAYIVAFRLTSFINAPIMTAPTAASRDAGLLQLDFLIPETAEKLAATWARAERLLNAFKDIHAPPPPVAPKEDPKDRWARKREEGLRKQAAALARRSAVCTALCVLAALHE